MNTPSLTEIVTMTPTQLLEKFAAMEAAIAQGSATTAGLREALRMAELEAFPELVRGALASELGDGNFDGSLLDMEEIRGKVLGYLIESIRFEASWILPPRTFTFITTWSVKGRVTVMATSEDAAEQLIEGGVEIDDVTWHTRGVAELDVVTEDCSHEQTDLERNGR